MNSKPPGILVLVVDDDVRTARLLVKMLRQDGFDVELATNGAAAIGRLAHGRPPDALVTDLRMPYVDGVAVAQYGRSRRADLPVFVVTGYPEQLSLLEHTMTPRPIVLTKPLDYGELLRGLRKSTGTLDAAPA